MFRGTTARSVISFLAAALLALQLFAPSASFASAHTTREAVAKAPTGADPAGRALRTETVSCHDAGRPGDPTGPLRPRDRHRATAAGAPQAAERPLTSRPTPAVSDPAPPDPGHRRPSRPSTDRTPAALQVFRC